MEGALLKLGLLEGDEDGWAERLGDSDGDVEGPSDGNVEGPVEGALLKLGLLEGDEDSWAERLGDQSLKLRPSRRIQV